MSTKWRDQQVAEEVVDESVLRCQAPGCPNAWSVSDSFGQKARGLCSAHRWGASDQWHRITDEQHRMLERRALDAMRPKPAVRRYTAAEKREILQTARAILQRPPEDPKAWAYRLRDREEGGEVLSPMQADAWRRALRLPTESRARVSEGAE